MLVILYSNNSNSDTPCIYQRATCAGHTGGNKEYAIYGSGRTTWGIQALHVRQQDCSPNAALPQRRAMQPSVRILSTLGSIVRAAHPRHLSCTNGLTSVAGGQDAPLTTKSPALPKRPSLSRHFSRCVQR